MTAKADIRAEADRLRQTFEDRDAQVFETDILQPAGALLDLYGEDIRARAFVTHDPLRGEMMLRPDFTVPLMQAHIEGSAATARYTYAGEIFRRQEDDDTRSTEYMQVGYEVVGGTDPVIDDAEVFAAIATALNGLPVSGTIGDIGILSAAVEALDTPERRKAALLRHLWRPNRFRALLTRFSQPAPPPPPPPPFEVPWIGLRTREDVETRRALLAEEAETPPITSAEIDRLNAILAVTAPAPEAMARLNDIAADGPLGSAIAHAEARLDAIASRGINPAELTFATSYGLTSLEYYSGFVFGFEGPGGGLVATGGRYDLLTAALNGGAAIPAVGAVIRPGAALALSGVEA